MQYPRRQFLRASLRHAAGSAVALAVPAAITPPVFAQADRRLVLGQSAPFSGPAAQLGLQMHAGARLVFDAVNAAGGIGGQKIELRTMDDQYEPAKCVANTEAFIKDDVFALFGYVGTPTTLAALPRLNEARLPLVGPFTGAMSLREPLQKQVFHVRASYHDETALIVRQLTSLGLKKIAVFRQNDSYGLAGLDGVLAALKPLNLAPVAIGTVERNSVDVAAAVAAIVPQRPDAVIQIGAYKGCAAFIRAARKAGYGGTFYNVSFVGTQALADELGKDGHGVMISQVMPFPFSTTTPISREYLAAVKAAGSNASAPAQANYSSMEGFVAAKVMVEGLRRAGKGAPREALVAALESINHWDLGGFTVNFSARDHVASHFVELSMLTDDGRVRR